jgi:hypothetical protein
MNEQKLNCSQLNNLFPRWSRDFLETGMTTATAGAETTEAAWHLWNNKLFTKLGAIKVAQFTDPCQEGKPRRETL